MGIRVSNLYIGYGNQFVLKNFNLELESGGLYIIKGSNGIGKSTLAHAITGIIPRDIQAFIKGNIIIDDKNIIDMSIAELCSSISIVLQNANSSLFSFTVRDELAFAPENMCFEKGIIRDKISEVIEKLELSSIIDSPITDLSGGEKKKVQIASVLTLDPNIIVFDEAMSSLDIDSRAKLRNIILDLIKQGKTIIMIEHMKTVDDIATRIIDFDKIISEATYD